MSPDLVKKHLNWLLLIKEQNAELRSIKRLAHGENYYVV